MQLHDDDMDELFRNAASQYPLKTDGADWDAVMRRLPQSGDKQTPAFNRLRENKWLKWLLGSVLTLVVLVIAVPALRVGVLPVVNNDTVNNSAVVIADSTANAMVVAVNTNSNNATVNTVRNNNNAAVNEEKRNSIASADRNNNNTVSTNRIGNAAATLNTNSNNATVNTVSNNNSNTVNAEKGNSIANANRKNNSTTVSADKNNTAITNKAIADRNNKTTALPYNNTAVPVHAVNNNSSFLVTDLLSLHLLTGVREKDPQVTATLQSNGSNIKLRQDTTVPKTKVKVQTGLYAGIIASPDISTVKGQRVSNVGYNAGLVFGYRISRRLAVETGVLYERKNYYSEASYFSTKKINIPPTMKLINVDGWCKMFEIPLNVRYVFSINEKRSWYANVGVSSYIMSKESYDYKYEMYNSVTTKRWSFNNATRNWFSIIHVGVGYEHRLGAVGTLRVEPYLKMPAGGVGIGSLPLTSVGLNVGITRPLRF